MRTLRSMSAVLCLMLLSGCPGQTLRPQPLRPDQVGHREAGIVFPETVAGLPCVEVRTYDAKGLDVSAVYALLDVSNPVVVTVYVYPASKLTSIGSPADVVATARRRLTDAHFEQVKREVVKRHPDASLLADTEATMVFRGESLYGRSATFTARDPSAGRTQWIMTHAEVFAFGKWVIKFRVTHPASTEGSAKGMIDAFKRAFCAANKGDADRTGHGDAQ